MRNFNLGLLVSLPLTRMLRLNIEQLYQYSYILGALIIFALVGLSNVYGQFKIEAGLMKIIVRLNGS